MGPIFTALGGKTDCSVFDSIEWFVGGKWSNTSLDSSPSFSLSQLFWNMLLAPNSDLYKNNKLYHFKHDISYLWTDIHDIHELYSVEYRSKMFLQMITFCFIQVYTASQLFSESGCKIHGQIVTVWAQNKPKVTEMVENDGLCYWSQF